MRLAGSTVLCTKKMSPSMPLKNSENPVALDLTPTNSGADAVGYVLAPFHPGGAAETLCATPFTQMNTLFGEPPLDSICTEKMFHRPVPKLVKKPVRPLAHVLRTPATRKLVDVYDGPN